MEDRKPIHVRHHQIERNQVRSATLIGSSSMMRIFILPNVLVSPCQPFCILAFEAVAFAELSIVSLLGRDRIFRPPRSTCFVYDAEELPHIERLGEVSTSACRHKPLYLTRCSVSADDYDRDLTRGVVTL